jgi:hypothetical protein
VEVFPVNDRYDVLAGSRRMFPPGILLCIVRGSPRNVMNGSYSDPSGPLLRSINHVRYSAWTAGAHAIPEAIFFLLHQPTAPRICEQRSRSVISRFGQCRAVEAVNGVISRDKTFEARISAVHFC